MSDPKLTPTSTTTVETSSNDKATAELSAVVEELLNGITGKFNAVSSEILSKSMKCSRNKLLQIRSRY
jgi:hypothetical protein